MKKQEKRILCIFMFHSASAPGLQVSLYYCFGYTSRRKNFSLDAWKRRYHKVSQGSACYKFHVGLAGNSSAAGAQVFWKSRDNQRLVSIVC